MPRAYVSPGRIGARRFGPQVYALELLRALARVAPPEWEVTYHWWGRRGAIDPDALFGAGSPLRVRRTPLPTRAYRHLASMPHGFVRPLVGSFDVFHQVGIDVDPPVVDERLVVSLHDLIGVRWPEGDGAFPSIAPELLHRAAAVLTVSDFSKAEIVDGFGLDPRRIVVIPNGCDASVFRSDAQLPVEVADRLKGRRYVLMVGGGTPRKNVPRALRAFDLARHDLDEDLVVVATGMVSTGAPELARDLASRGALVDLGYQGTTALAGLMSHASLLLYPSLYEGFGLPVLEAYAAGCPVVTSDGSSLTDVAGGLATLVDPTSEVSIAEGIARILGWGSAERAAWRTGARERAETRSWDECARAHLVAYDSVRRAAG